jgi:hypothetical protein
MKTFARSSYRVRTVTHVPKGTLAVLLVTMLFGCSDATNPLPANTTPPQPDTEVTDGNEAPDDASDGVRGDADVPWQPVDDVVADSTDEGPDSIDASPEVTGTDTTPSEDTDVELETSPDTTADTRTIAEDSVNLSDASDDPPAACTALVTTPADFDHTFSWDAEGRLMGIAWTFPPPLGPGPSEPQDSTATHDDDGRLLSTCCRHWPYPSGDAHHAYDDAGRHLGYEVVTPANPSAKPWEDLAYTWHDDGTVASATRLTQIAEESLETWSFVYAPDGRLAQRSYDNWIEEVHYDDAGCLSYFLQKFLLPGDGPAELMLTIEHDAEGRLTAFNHPTQGTTIISWSAGCDLINVGIPSYPGVIDPRFLGLPTQLLPGRVCPP